MIYLDNASTTKIRSEVFETMKPWLTEKYGNPSSVHSLGEEAAEAVERSREIIAKKINAKASEIIFTSCATESNNIVINGANGAGRKLFISPIEHASVNNPAKRLKARFLKADTEGFVDTEIEKNSFLSVIYANNEIGTIQDVEKISDICSDKNVWFHSDAAQANGKVMIRAGLFDFLSLSAHKIHGPKGIGALYVKEGIKLEPLMMGGGQQKGLRPGTENVASIVGFAKAFELMDEEYCEKVSELRDRLIKKVLEIPGAALTGPVDKKKRLCNIASFAFDVDGEKLVKLLDSRGICASTGSACSEGNVEVSHVLKAIGLREKLARGSLRLSPGIFNTKQEIDEAVEAIHEAVESLRIV